MGAHGWGLATVYQVKNSFVRISNISPIFSHFKLVFSYTLLTFCGDVSKLVCRSLSRIAMITNIDFPVQTNFTIHAHIFAVYSCQRLHFIDPININRAKHFFFTFFPQRAPILILRAGALGQWLAPLPFTPESGVRFPVSAVWKKQNCFFPIHVWKLVLWGASVTER